MTLQIGNHAPEFNLSATGGRNISAADLKGKIAVIYFYPKDDTPGCTVQACSFRDNFNRLAGMGVTVLGISKDDLASHEKFREKFGLNFPLASDPTGATIQAFDSWGEKSLFGKKYMGTQRNTFLLDAAGIIRQIWRDAKVEGHTDDVIKAIQKLQQPAGETGGQSGPEPTRFGDWEKAGRCTDF